jgi:hypothetical protein
MAPLFTKPARDLTEPEANSILTYLQREGEVGLYDPKHSGSAPRGQIRMRTTIAGVEYWQASGKNGASRFGSVGAHAVQDFYPTPQFAVVLYKLAVRLRDRWGATKIIWGGIGQGSGLSATDCHAKGHCIDFYGATTSRAGVLDVKRDWYLHPVYLANGKLHAPPPHKPKDGLAFDYDRWGIDNNTSYRLLLPTNDVEKMPTEKDYYNTKARDFFCDVYTFVSEQCAFGANDISPASFKAGHTLKAGYTLHPDYPSAKRIGHMDHMHFQLGKAF